MLTEMWIVVRNKVYTNFLYTGQIRDKVYTGQILYGDKIYTRTTFIRGQSLYGKKFIRRQSLSEDKVYSNFFHTALELKDIKWICVHLLDMYTLYNAHLIFNFQGPLIL